MTRSNYQQVIDWLAARVADAVKHLGNGRGS